MILKYDIIFNKMKKVEIGDFLEKRRKSLRVTQRGLARLCGISEHALSNLESGIGNPTFDLLENVADALGLEISLVPKTLEPK